MNKETINQGTSTKNEFKFIAKPVIILSVLIALFIVLFTVGVEKINETRQQIAESSQLGDVLKKKILILESIPSVLSGDTTFLDVALPSRGAVLFALSQIKGQASANNILITNLKAGSTMPVQNDISKISINFDMDGTEESVYSFLGSFSKLLPLMSVDSIKLDKSSLGLRASATIYVYTAELPTKIQAVTSGSTELTAADINTITEIAGYTVPQFIEPKPSETEVKTDPFN